MCLLGGKCIRELLDNQGVVQEQMWFASVPLLQIFRLWNHLHKVLYAMTFMLFLEVNGNNLFQDVVMAMPNNENN